MVNSQAMMRWAMGMPMALISMIQRFGISMYIASFPLCFYTAPCVDYGGEEEALVEDE